MLNFKLLLAALEVFRDLKDSHHVVVTSCRHESVVKANSSVIECRILRAEVTLELLKELKLSTLLVN